jgi:hypothetical protein
MAREKEPEPTQPSPSPSAPPELEPAGAGSPFPYPLPPGFVICPYCAAPTPLDYVHGHAQCVQCKMNIEPCCNGAPDERGGWEPR